MKYLMDKNRDVSRVSWYIIRKSEYEHSCSSLSTPPPIPRKIETNPGGYSLK